MYKWRRAKNKGCSNGIAAAVMADWTQEAPIFEEGLDHSHFPFIIKTNY